MARKKKVATKRKPHKTHVARKPDEVVDYKKLFIEELQEGWQPSVAAKRIGVSRSAVYNWKKADQVFDAEWRDGIETGLDVLEARVFKRGMNGSSSDAQFILKHRRFGGDSNKPYSNFVMNISLAEHTKRLERLGLPVPQIESDYEPWDEEPEVVTAA
jgi:hypothetical protein